MIDCATGCNFDTVTIGSEFVTGSGQEQTATELFHTDGKEHLGTLSAGVLQARAPLKRAPKKTGRTLA